MVNKQGLNQIIKEINKSMDKALHNTQLVTRYYHPISFNHCKS